MTNSILLQVKLYFTTHDPESFSDNEDGYGNQLTVSGLLVGADSDNDLVEDSEDLSDTESESEWDQQNMLGHVW